MVEAGKNGHPEQPGEAHASGQLAPELFRTLVHELRNPLAPIRNAAELLRTLCTDPRQLQSVDIISRQVSALTRALDDLTGALSSTRNHLLISKQAVDVAEIVEPALQAIRPVVDARRQNLLVSLPNEPLQMYCDPLRVTQVVQTLLENAVSHTPAGGSIALRVSDEHGQLRIQVLDDGTGIPPDRLRSIFNMYARCDAATDGQQPSGLSLAISRNIVEMHGGMIDAYSEGAGRGSRFIVQLPLAEEHNAPRPAAPVDARKVVIIDDYEDNVASLRDVIAAAGHEVLAAGTGELGIALARAFEPDVVIIDIGLPGMDGFEVAKRLREHSTTANSLLIAVSGFSLKQFRELSAYSMFRHYLLKPAHPETILAIIDGMSTASSR